MKLLYCFTAVALLLALLALLACNGEDDLITDSSAQLEFSRDTLTFDTVFTQLGSATRILKVYNPHSQPIRIDRIYVASGSQSKFRFNVDGESSNDVRDIEIRAQDSLYIFGEVTVDPDQDVSISPFVINDALQFETNGNEQTIVLEAWGQNANYFPSRFSNDSITAFSCGGAQLVWDDPKPYVIYGIVFFDECELVIPAGAEIYVHGGLGSFFDEDGNRLLYNDGRIVIGPNASIRIEGTVDNPVTIQGDRLEEFFDEVPGQWYGLILSPESRNNVIEHAVIKNAVVGVVVDSLARLDIRNTQIYNTTANALFGRHASIQATNCLFRDNSANSVRVSQGGDYNFDYCTLATFGTDASALSLSNVRCLDPFCQEFFDNDLNARFRNCIITGSQSDQITLADLSDAVAFNYTFEHCIVRVEELLEDDAYPNFLTDDCNTCINNTNRESSLFLDIDEGDYHLDTLSIAEGQAIPLPGITTDLDLVDRDEQVPDIGCYEYVYE